MAEENDTAAEESWEVVTSVNTEEEAELVAGYLRNEDVPCRVESSHSHEFPVTVSEQLSVVRIEVPVARFGEARRLLDELDAGRTQVVADEPVGTEELEET